jgi:predicted nucleic acid-binding Zn ribbon protein
MNATDAPVCCMVCRKAVAVHIVKDFAHHTYPACKACLATMRKAHPTAPVVVK